MRKFIEKIQIFALRLVAPKLTYHQALQIIWSGK